MQTTKVNGAELQYEVAGTGEPVLLIGTGPIADSFLPFLSQRVLVERYRLIRYRQRQLADTGDGPAPVSFAEHASDAAALLAHLGVRRAHIAGHSTGAVTALQLAVDRPDLVHSLALLEPVLLGVPSTAAFLEQVGPAVATCRSGDGDGAMAEFLSVACSLDWEACRMAIDTHVPGGVAKALKDADNWFGSYLPALAAWQFGSEQAAGISQPVLSVQGTETHQLFVDGDELLHSWFSQIEDCTIQGVAHLLHLQRLEPVVRGTADFFNRHPIAAGEPGIA
jgi:pimeloyl-ACP methyl ester carboxylesterase